jgi:hypothetical protein
MTRFSTMIKGIIRSLRIPMVFILFPSTLFIAEFYSQQSPRARHHLKACPPRDALF